MAKAPGYTPSKKGAGLTKKAGYFIVDKNTGVMVDRQLFDVTYRDSGLLVSPDEQIGEWSVSAGWTAETIDSQDNPLKRSALRSALGKRFIQKNVAKWKAKGGASDQEIKEAVSEVFGYGGGGSSFGGYSYKGGKNPSFQLDSNWGDSGGDKREFKGKELAKLVRESYGIKDGVRSVPFGFPRLAPNEIAFEIPPKDMWIFDQTEDLKPNGAEYQSLREHLIRDYVEEYYKKNSNWHRGMLEGPFKHTVQESASRNKSSWRVPDFETLTLFNDVVADGSSFSDAVDDWDYHFPNDVAAAARKPILAAPYRVEVSWAEDPTLRNLKEDGVEIEGDGGDPFKQKPEDRPNSFPAWSLDEAKEIMQAVKKYDPDNVAISEVSDEHLQKWAVLVNRSGDYKMVQDAENREEYRKEIFDAQEELAELSNGFIEDIMVYEMRGDEGKDQFFESASEGEVDFIDLYNNGNFEVKSLDKFGGVMMSSMVDFNLNPEPTDNGKGGGWMLDGEVQDGAPPIKDEIKKVIEEYSAFEDSKKLPFRDPYHQDDPPHTFEALNEAGKLQFGTRMKFTDLSTEAAAKAVRDYIEGYADGTGYEGDELPTSEEVFEILKIDKLEDRYDSEGNLTVSEGEPVDVDGVAGHNSPYAHDWDQDDVLDSLEAGNYGRFLPRVFGNERKKWYAAEPRIHGMPTGELTLNPRVDESVDGWNFTKTWDIENQGGKYAQPYRLRSKNDFTITKRAYPTSWSTGAIEPDFTHKSWKNRPMDNKNPQTGKPGSKQHKNKPHVFRRVYRDARGRPLEYTSNDTNSGLVIWKDQESARQSARIARSRGWLIRTVPIGPKNNRKWVNLGNNILLKQRGIPKSKQPTYWRKKR